MIFTLKDFENMEGGNVLKVEVLLLVCLNEVCRCACCVKIEKKKGGGAYRCS